MEENYHKNYYQKNKELLLKNAKEYYRRTKKKTPKCKMCGVKMPEEHGSIKYCQNCLSAPGHGADAHRMAAVRWFRKNHLTKSNIISKI